MALASLRKRQNPLCRLILIAGVFTGAQWFNSAVFADATFAETVVVYNGAATTVQWGDIDGDNLKDIFVAEGGKHSGGTGSRILAWFKAPDWVRNDVATPLGAFTGDSALVDVDDDDDLDIVISKDNHGSQNPPGAVYWYENTGNFNQDWPQHTIEASVPNAFHIGDMDTADVDGDGKLDVVVRHLSTLRFVVYFQNSADSWTPVRLDTRHREGLFLGDLDGNDRVDIIGNGYILFAPENPRTGSWTEVIFDNNYLNASQSGLNNSIKGAVADMDGDLRPDIVMSSAEGAAVYLAWFKNPANAQTGTWNKNIIESPQGKNHQVEVVDVDLDGDIDVYGGFSFGSKGVYWWENLNGLATSWARNTIDSSEGCYYCSAADYDNDGDYDLMGPTKYVGKVNLFRNTTADSSATLTVAPQSLDFGTAAGSQNVTLTASAGWTAVSNQPAWLSVAPSSGSADDTLAISVTAHNGIGNRSGTVVVSNGTIFRNIAISQQGVPDTLPPTTPGGLAGSDLSHNSVRLSWNAATDNSGVIEAYKIYRDGSAIAATANIASVVTGLVAETLYRFRVSAVDPAGNESPLSSEVTVTTLETPPVAPPIGHWKLDETSGSSAASVSGPFTGTLANMTGSEWQPGRLGNALHFDGDNDYVALGNIDLGSALAPASAMTISAWVNPDTFATTPEGRIVSKASALTSGAHYWMLSTIKSGNNHVPRFRLRTNGSTTTLVASSNANINTNAWSHLVATYDGNTMQLFLNGELAGALSKSGDIDRSSGTGVAIGNQPQGDRPFDGLIDDVCLMDYALDIDDVGFLYNQSAGASCDSLVAGNSSDMMAPLLTEESAVVTPTTDSTPGYIFSTSETGIVAYGGNCSGTVGGQVSAGTVELSFTGLALGLHDNCTVTVTDSAGNASMPLTVTAFTIEAPVTGDITPPVILEVIAVATPGTDVTPEYRFASNEAGTATFGGDCAGTSPLTVSAGEVNVVFATLSIGLHSNCTVTVTDAANNASLPLTVTAFTIEAGPGNDDGDQDICFPVKTSQQTVMLICL